jgi:hypothetical protein
MEEKKNKDKQDIQKVDAKAEKENIENKDNKEQKLNKEREQKKKKLSKQKQQYIIYGILILCIIILPLIVSSIKNAQIKKLKAEHTIFIDSLQTTAKQDVAKAYEEKLELIGEVFSWLVITELSHKQTTQIEKYMIELVKIPEFQELALIDRTGKILLATDKTNEGGEFSDMFPAQMYFNKGKNKVKTMNNGVFFTSKEIAVNNTVFGYLIITYKANY